MKIKNMMRSVGVVLPFTVMIAISIGCSSKEPTVSTTDSTITINGMTWTRQNLNIETRDSWCYDDADSNCAKYGRLYTYEAANTACASMGGKWRLPTNKDWNDLMKAVGGVKKVGKGGDVHYMDAGKKLKSKSGWNDIGSGTSGSGNGTDDYGFSAMPGGGRNYYNGEFSGAGYNGNWWSATDVGGAAYYRYMENYYGSVDELVNDKIGGFSVRCVLGNAVTPQPPPQLTVSFDANGGNLADINPIDIDSGKAVGTLPVVTRDGYGFDGWFDSDGQRYTLSTIIAKNAVLTARWAAVIKTDSTVTINGKTWMRQNLNIETPDSWCYDNDPNNCAIYGRLYTYEAAKKACQSLNGKWRLPTNEDWDNLIEAVGGVKSGIGVYKNAGKKLKSKSGWEENGNGTDDYGFSAMPSGNRGDDFGFYFVGKHGRWWSATESGTRNACHRLMHYRNDDVGEYASATWNGFSVRCVGGE